MATTELVERIIIDIGGNESVQVKPGENLVHVQFLEETRNDISVTVSENSGYTNFIISNKNCISNVNATLSGPNSSVKLFGLFPHTTPSRVKTSIQHETEGGYSEQEYRYILNNDCEANLEAELAIHHNRQNNKAVQFCRGILLSDKASLKARPSLRIANDQVECSHGIALGKIDEKSIQYLNQRGIPSKVATGMLVHAFANYIIEKLPTEDLRGQALLKLQAVL